MADEGFEDTDLLKCNNVLSTIYHCRATNLPLKEKERYTF